MKTIVRTLMGIVAASVAAVSVLTVSAVAVADGVGSARSGLVKTTSDTWAGDFECDNPGKYSNYFSDPTGFSVDVNGGNGKGTASTTLTAKNGFTAKFKQVTVKTVSSDGTPKMATSSESAGKGNPVAVSATYTTGFYPLSISYYGYLYNGDDSTTGILNRTVIYTYITGNKPAAVDEEVTE